MSIQLERPASHPHVAVVTIDRPARANSLDPEHLAALAGAWRSIASDPDVRCAVLTGAGERVFCAGANPPLSPLKFVVKAESTPMTMASGVTAVIARLIA